jgi:predicted site-specific integrase-resolvase
MTEAKARVASGGLDVIEVDGERFYTAAGAAKVLHLNEQTIRRYFREGALKGSRPRGKVIYFSGADIRAFLTGAGQGKG